MNTTDNANELKKNEKQLLFAIVALVVILVLVCILGLILIKPADESIQGQADATTVRVSGKMPGRVIEFYVEEGEAVHKGDTLVKIQSSLVDAKLLQAQSMQIVAQSQSQKVEKGTRQEIVTAAYNMWQTALSAHEIAKKTFDRISNLYKEGVVSAQKRDEAEAAFKATKAQAEAAKSQYDMAKTGAQKEDKEAANAMKNAAKGSVMEVESILEDQYLTAPCDGEISDIYPHEGELVMTGAPVMSILKKDDMWVSFNVREDMLNSFTMGKEIKVMIPGLDKKETTLKVFYIHDLGSYATWSATKSAGQYDSKTFEIKARSTTPIENLRPGMSVIYVEE